MLLKSFSILFLFCLLTASSPAQDVEKDFQTESISIFKNGTAFFIKSGEVSTTDAQYQMHKHIPAALFGTYWIHSQDQNLKQVISFVDTLTEKENYPSIGIPQLLRLNSDKDIQIHLKDKIIRGKVVNTIDKSKWSNLSAEPYQYSFLLNTIENEWVTIKTEDVDHISFAQKPNMEIEKTVRKPQEVIQIDFVKKKEKEKLNMMYLAGNISWSPNYLIELTSEESANLTLRAEMTNDAEAINNTDINFVVGVPNFKYANKLSSLVSFIKQFQGNYRQEAAFHNVQLQNQSIAYGIDAAATVNPGGDGTTTEGSEQEDLYFYTLNNISLPKGGRGHYNLFNNKIAIRHIFECSLTSSNANVHRNNATSILSNPNNVIAVTHAIKVINNTKAPWTTGSAMVVTDENKPISQDQLNYTPVSGHSFVKLTTSPDVQVKHSEKVVSTEERAKSVKRTNRTYFYDKITIEGTIKVKNYKSKDIDLNIRRAITGHLEESSIKWLQSERVQHHHQLNLVTDVCWETSVKSGGDLKVVYRYYIYAGH